MAGGIEGGMIRKAGAGAKAAGPSETKGESEGSKKKAMVKNAAGYDAQAAKLAPEGKAAAGQKKTTKG